ncbi:hypothetical protein ACKVMT_06200 [Halobacteriales archaeon Cl-PHB]
MPESESPEITVDESTGVGTVTLDETAGMSANLELVNSQSESARINASGYWYDDEPPEVNLRVGFASGSISLSMSPERARRVAADLQMAAVHATTGDAELGEEQANDRE